MKEKFDIVGARGTLCDLGGVPPDLPLRICNGGFKGRCLFRQGGQSVYGVAGVGEP